MKTSSRSYGAAGDAEAFGDAELTKLTPAWASVTLAPGYALNGAFSTLNFTGSVAGISTFSSDMPAGGALGSVSTSGVRTWSGVGGLCPKQGQELDDPGDDSGEATNAVVFRLGSTVPWAWDITGGTLEVVEYPVAVGMIHT